MQYPLEERIGTPELLVGRAQEFKKFNIVDYFTKGLTYYDVATGQQRPHPNNDALHHLYNPCFSANGKWIAATVHAGMGYDHASLLIEADGTRIVVPGTQVVELQVRVQALPGVQVAVGRRACRREVCVWRRWPHRRRYRGPPEAHRPRPGRSCRRQAVRGA